MAGEIGLDTTSNIIKIGNGIDQWNSLPSAGIKGNPGLNATVTLNSGAFKFFPRDPSDVPIGWILCNGALISAATYTSLVGLLPVKPGFTGGVGAEYGPGSTQGITVSASSVLTLDASYSVANVDDGNVSPRWHSNNDLPGTWLKFTFPLNIVINQYYMSASSDQDWSPTAWTFQGSNDDVNWTILNTIDNGTTQTIVSGASQPIATSQMSGFSFSNTTPYKHYRWVFTNATFGTPGYVVLSEVALVGPVVFPDSSQLLLPQINTTTINDVVYYPYMKV